MAVMSPDMIADNSPRGGNPAGRAAFLALILPGSGNYCPHLPARRYDAMSPERRFVMEHYQIDRSFGSIVVLRLQEGINRE